MILDRATAVLVVVVTRCESAAPASLFMYLCTTCAAYNYGAQSNSTTRWAKKTCTTLLAVVTRSHNVVTHVVQVGCGLYAAELLSDRLHG